MWGAVTNSKHWFTTSFLQPQPYLVTPKDPQNCQLTSSFFVGAQTVVSLLQTTQIKQSMSFIAVIKVYTSTNKTTVVWIETELLFYTGGCVSCLFTCVLWCKVASTVILVTKLQAMVYDILPSTTAVFSYAIGSRKLSANEQFFCWCSDSSKFVTNNSNKTRPGWMRLMFTCVLWH